MLAIEELPPIVITQDNILVDGWHRLEAYRRIAQDIADGILDADVMLSRGFDPLQIEVEVVELTEDEVLIEAARLNAHGQVVMSREEKRRVAEQLCDRYSDREIAGALGIPRSTVNYWTKEHREKMRRIAQQVLFEYTDKYPDKSQKEIRELVRENEGITIPRSTHSDWLRDRAKIEASWQEPKPEPYDVPPGGTSQDEGMTYEEYEKYIESAQSISTATADSMPDTLAEPIPDASIAYICDDYEAEQDGIPDKEYLQSGCLLCKCLSRNDTDGKGILLECTEGHRLIITGLRRER